ncbi:helix-turn-helix domain-containing protein [Streptomyces sp. f51]|uniref:helix-turn-helix domain-containing protein n=1 Tax=Streptomyces sp. f51 TaxID=1827742 RepID=UPI0030D5DCCA
MTSSRATGAENSSADPPASRQNSRPAADGSARPDDESGNGAGTTGPTETGAVAQPENADTGRGARPGSADSGPGGPPDRAGTDRAAEPDNAGKDRAAQSDNAGTGRAAPPVPAGTGGGAPPERVDTGDVLAASVARVRRAAGLTLSAVATRAGVSPAYVSQMESGAANPTVRTLCQIADALGSTPAELLGGTGQVTAAAAPAFPPRFAPAPLLAQADGHHGIWDLTAPGASRIGARLLHADLGDHDHPTAHSGEEFALVLAGSCRVSVGGVVRLLRRADSCHFAATDEHHFTDPSDDLLMLVVLTEE